MWYYSLIESSTRSSTWKYAWLIKCFSLHVWLSTIVSPPLCHAITSAVYCITALMFSSFHFMHLHLTFDWPSETTACKLVCVCVVRVFSVCCIFCDVSTSPLLLLCVCSAIVLYREIFSMITFNLVIIHLLSSHCLPCGLSLSGSTVCKLCLHVHTHFNGY